MKVFEELDASLHSERKTFAHLPVEKENSRLYVAEPPWGGFGRIRQPRQDSYASD
jgi:hypothetical protein